MSDSRSRREPRSHSEAWQVAEALGRLGNDLRASGRFGDARKAYEAALEIAVELKDLRSQGVDLARLGALALAEGKLEEALTRHQAAQRLFQQLHETQMEAAA